MSGLVWGERGKGGTNYALYCFMSCMTENNVCFIFNSDLFVFSGAWNSVIDKIQDARTNARMKQLDFGGSYQRLLDLHIDSNLDVYCLSILK